MPFLPSDQKTKEVNIHEEVTAQEYNERLAKGVDQDIQKILSKTFSDFAKQMLGKGTLSEMSPREKKTILDSIKFRKESYEIDPKKWGYNWRHFENKVMSFK